MSFFKSKWFLLLSGLVLGALTILAIRFATYKSDAVHYHANFAVFINGQQELFKGSQYYEEDSAMCTTAGTVTPAGRAHMHDNIYNVIHIEDHAVTWGNFFANIGWYIGPDFIEARDGTMYANVGGNKVHYIINGQDYTDLGGVANIEIKDQDKLLIDYGSTAPSSLAKEYASIPSTAKRYDNTPDPASCSGAKQPSLQDRLVHLF